MTVGKNASEFLRQAGVITDHQMWWQMRCRYARPDQIAEEREDFELKMIDLFRQLKAFYCEHRDEIVAANFEDMSRNLVGLDKAIEAMESVIQDDLEREFGLAHYSDP